MKKYETPALEIVLFGKDDIIVTSGETSTETYYGDGGTDDGTNETGWK